jgi:RNA polymerase sigma factor (sigma-70 family)
MRMPQGSGSGVQTVIAAQRGDQQALDSLLSQYLPLTYNIVGRALNGHADVDDVVQETMMRVVRGVGDLRDPTAFRSWLVAVAIRQVRDHCQARQAAPVQGIRPDIADPGADFVDVTILRLGLSGQRRETAQAARWLDADDRELLALWWLETGGELDRGEIAAALGLPAAHAAVRIARMKEQLTTSRVVVRALAAVPRCEALASALAAWDQDPGPLWRKRIARHAGHCRQCSAHYDGLIPAERLLGGLPLVPAAAAAGYARLHQGGQARSRSGQSRIRSRHAHSATHHALRLRAPGLRHLRMLAKGASVPAKIAAVSVAASCAAAGTFAVVRAHHTPPALIRSAAAASPVTTAVTRPEPSRPPRLVPPKARPAAVTAARAKKGVSAWAFTGARQAFKESGASWYYTWASNHAGISSPGGVKFVPIIWGPGSVSAATLSQAEHYGHILLGFNEPDMSSQSNMTVSQALNLWPRLMATGMRLGSPAVSAGAATPGGWLDRFMTGAAARGYRVNFITVHWYGGDFATGPAVSQLKTYLRQIHARYGRPIWLTEFALTNFGTSPASFPTQRGQATFVQAAIAMLDRLSYVQRYAWFALPVSATDGTVGLFRSGPVATRVGRAFEAAP